MNETPTLDEYMASTDSNAFWRLSAGDHQNLLDEAIDRMAEARRERDIAHGCLEGTAAACDEARLERSEFKAQLDAARAALREACQQVESFMYMAVKEMGETKELFALRQVVQRWQAALGTVAGAQEGGTTPNPAQVQP